VTQSVATNEQDLKSATAIREKENSDFQSEEKELLETVSMLRRAQSVLSKALNKEGSFMQTAGEDELTALFATLVNSAVASSQNKRRLHAFLQNQENGVNQPEAKAYESHSGGILDTLADMQDKAEGLLEEARKNEMNAKHNFELLAQSLNDDIKVQTEALGTAKKQISARREAAAEAGGDKAVTDKDVSEDQKYLDDLSVNCQQRAVDWETSQKGRAEELKALDEATRILSEMTGGASKRQYASLVQMASTVQSASPFDVAARSIKALGRKTEDYGLTQLAARVRSLAMSLDDPFAKVKGLIQDMVDRLQKEAQEEASQKAFCDKEMGESNAKREKHQQTVDKLSTRIEKAQATKDKLKEQVATLQAELASLADNQRRMDSMRQEENEEYTKAHAEFSQGLEGVRLALNVLRDYYAQQSAFVQQPAVGSHAKSGDAATGIIGMLEVIESDFARSVAETQETEDAAQSTYDKTSQENRVSKSTKESEVKFKTQEQDHLAKAISEASDDRSGEEDELDAVMEYLSKLKPQCTTKPVSYEERKKRRESEISGLKSALEILENETAGDSFLALKTVTRHL